MYNILYMYIYDRGEQMKTILSVLKDKLNALGYNDSISNSILKKFDLALIEKQISDESEYENIIEIDEFEEPTVEIIELFLNIKYDVLHVEVLEGDIELSSTETAVGTRFAIADYTLSKRCALMAMTADLKIKIMIYNPSPKVQNLYNGIKYEQNYKKERDEIVKEYFEAFLENGRVPERKIREILTMLVSDYVIDDMAVNGLNPRIKMYDNELKYAENLYSYSLRFINLRNNRIELLNKKARIIRSSKTVQPGDVTNDPYIKLDKMPIEVDFPLNTISYYWISKNINDEIAIFIAPRVYPQATFAELKKEDPKISQLAGDLSRRFRRESNIDIKTSFIESVLRKLNYELMFPSSNIIRDNLVNKTDLIENIAYKYKVINDPTEFEELLYITIEDNVSRRYKYSLVENVIEDLTTIGNKLAYTDENGMLVNKQTVADFNVNAPAVIIRRETFIDITRIPDLLGYIYEDMKYYGTDGLPVPTIEVIFYVPKIEFSSSSVTMFNGTSLDFSIDNVSKKNLFNDKADASYMIGGTNALPGSTFVTVKYVNSKDEVLKENRVGNVFPKTTYLPEIIPVINDKEGKEWIFSSKEVTPYLLSENPEMNVIELKYSEKFARVTLSYINREGKKIADDKQEIIQVGSSYDFSDKGFFNDKNGDDWKLVLSRPSKLVVKDNDAKNRILLVYDIEKADVIVRFLTKDGVNIANDEILQAAVDKTYIATKKPYIVDSNGLGWNYIESSVASVVVKNSGENVINLMYEEAKQQVITRIISTSGIKLADDKIDFVQIGKKFFAHFDDEVIDYSLKEWLLENVEKNEIIVNKDESQNIVQAVYKPRIAKVMVRLLNMNERPIKDALIEEAQVGDVYNADGKKEVLDNYGKVWVCQEKGNAVIISKIESKNVVSLKYSPLLAKVTVKYYSAEMEELHEPKDEMVQVGSEYKSFPIKRITDKLGKRWILDESKVPKLVVKKYEEENIVSVYYDKENTKVKLNFVDVYGNKLRDEQVIEAQIGSKLDNNLFFKITDTSGIKWMLADTEPKNCIIRDGENSVKLIYDEIKAKVLVKHIAVKTQKTFVEDVISTVKLGGIFVPNIRQIIFDNNKWKWKYIGEQNMSIVTKENEQENIIVLMYDEVTNKVVYKYRNKDGEQIKEDNFIELQIGKEIEQNAVDKFNDSQGLGWKYKNTKCENKYVLDTENIVTNYYEPLNAEVIKQYINEDGKEVIPAKKLMMQVGKKFAPEIESKIVDGSGCMWKYENISANEMKIQEQTNIVIYKYSKLLADTRVNYLDEEGNKIAEPIIAKAQVGTTFTPSIVKTYEDSEGKAWMFKTIDFNAIKVDENVENNVINITFKKELVDVKLSFFGSMMQMIKDPQVVKVQIGSFYTPTPEKIIIDAKKIGWILLEDTLPKQKVKRNPEDNLLNISYDKYLVDTKVMFKDDDGNEIIKPTITKQQVGTAFLPKIADYIEDNEGKEWIYGLRVENKFFTTAKKIEPLVISENVEKNIIKLHYKKSMNKVVVRYIDPLGTEIRSAITAEAQIGSQYTPEIIEKIVGAGNVKWTYNPNSNSTIKISKDEKSNVINLAYEEEKATVTYKYLDEYNNELKETKKLLEQIGSVYVAEPENVISGADDRVWELKKKSVNEIKVDEDASKNIIEVIYAPLNVDVVIKFVTLKGKTIISNKTVKAQLGSEFKLNVDATISDNDSKLFKFVKCEPEKIKVKELPVGATGNINEFTLTYEAVYSNAGICFKDIDGKQLKDNTVEQLQVGTIYAPEAIQYIKDKNGIQWQLITDKIDSLRVKENEKENFVTMVYEVAKAEISVRYKNVDGYTIKESDIFHLEIGKEFVPRAEEEIVDKDGKKWVYSSINPVKLTVSSINNIVNVIYMEKKAMTVVKYQTTDGKKLKEDLRAKVQIGSKYNPKPANKVIYDANNAMWRYAYNSPNDIVVSENVEENVIIQYYTTESTVTKENNNKTYYNPDVAKFVDQELVEEANRAELMRIEFEKKQEELRKKQEAEKANAVKLSDDHLRKLETNIILTNSQKETINKLNECNSEIIKLLHEAIDSNGATLPELEEKLNTIMRKEKELVQEGLTDIIAEDKTGNKVLQIFEAITASELNDKEFDFLQKKKSIIFTDFFVGNSLTDIEQATYIVEKGKTDKEIECIDKKIAATKGRNQELNKIKIILIYERSMLLNYYRARTTVKDDYFKNNEAKSKLSSDVIVLVTNMLPNQAIKLFDKVMTLSVAQRNELDAIMEMLNTSQISTVNDAIARFSDGKTRKAAQKLFKEIIK